MTSKLSHPDSGQKPLPGASVAGAVTAAICAGIAAGPADAALTIVDINPDVTLGSYNLDINGDSNPEFGFTRMSGMGVTTNTVSTGTNAVVQGSGKFPGDYAAALSGGEVIDASRTFISSPNALLSAKFFVVDDGEFFDRSLAYLGIRFDLPSTTGDHFGWVEISSVDEDLTLLRYAYETTPGAAVTTPGSVPEPGTLTLLVAGAAGVLAMRRRQRRT